MFKSIVCISLLVCSVNINAQDKLVLASGEKLKGTITDYQQGSSVNIKTKNETLSFSPEEVKKVQLNAFSVASLKEKGYFNETTVGGIFGNSNNAYRTGGFSMGTINGYQTKRMNYGIGFGLETWSESFTFPAFASVKYFPFGNVQTSPFVGLNAGYNFGPKSDNYYYPMYDCYDCNFYYYNNSSKRGTMSTAEIGIRRSVGNNLAFVLSSGLRYQYHELTYINYEGHESNTDEHLFRFQLKFGFYFN